MSPKAQSLGFKITKVRKSFFFFMKSFFSVLEGVLFFVVEMFLVFSTRKKIRMVK